MIRFSLTRTLLARNLAALAAAVTLGACATASTAPAADAVQIAPLVFSERTLANGLRVYAMPDVNTSTVSVQVWYDVGSKDDPAGRSGFAHLFEHIMFKATRNMPSETLDRMTEDVGGFNNASTYDDLTNYFEVVPAHHLERILWAEAERMGSLVVDEAIFDSERDVVKEELRQRVLAEPYGKLFYLYLPQTGYNVHPYGRPGIGSIEDLDAATVDDVRAFHAQYYRPDNAVLVVAGNFDPAQLNTWVDRYFGPISQPERAIPRVSVVEPPRPARDYTVYEPNTPLPALLVSYPTPAARSADIPALMVLDAIVSKGESSRLHQSMVYQQQMAAEVFTFTEATQQPGQYAFGVILSDGKTTQDALISLSAEIARLRDAPVSAAELDEAKNELIAATLENRETAYGRAFELADSVIRYGDAGYADRLVAAIQTVTAADVQRVARGVFNDAHRVVIHYLPEEAKPEGASSDVIATPASVQAQILSVPASEIEIITAAPASERVAPPPPAAPADAAMPAPVERTLPNGLRVIVASARGLPLISAQLRVLSGDADDPAARAGVAELTANLVTQGTTTRSATDVARAIESLGASLSAGSLADTSTLALQTRADRAEEAFTVFADVALNPVFAEAELARQRQQMLDGLSVGLRQPGTVAASAMNRVLFGAGPYGGVASPASVAAITQTDVQTFHGAHWRMDNAVLVIVGDISSDEGFALATRFFGAMPANAPQRPQSNSGSNSTAAPSGRRDVFIDLPGSGQAAVSFGMLGAPRSDRDYFPGIVVNSVLGGGYSARLNQEIRIKRGLSYGAGASFPARQEAGPIVAATQTRNDAAVQVVGLMETELRRLGREPIPAAELEARKASLIGAFARDVETTSGLAGQLAQIAAFGLPLDELAKYIANVSGVTEAQARAAAARFYDPARASLVVVGDGALVFNPLRRQRRGLERIDIDALDLDSASLK